VPSLVQLPLSLVAGMAAGGARSSSSTASPPQAALQLGQQLSIPELLALLPADSILQQALAGAGGTATIVLVHTQTKQESTDERDAGHAAAPAGEGSGKPDAAASEAGGGPECEGSSSSNDDPVLSAADTLAALLSHQPPATRHRQHRQVGVYSRGLPCGWERRGEAAWPHHLAATAQLALHYTTTTHVWRLTV
jgi:hypothetical protein